MKRLFIEDLGRSHGRRLGLAWGLVLGVLLGLYICSIPAKTFMDVLFADRFAAQRFWSNPPVLAMQGFTLVVGTLVIWAGMLCLMRA